MQLLKAVKSLQSELSLLPKLYHSHLWITPPAADGLSFIGISEWAKRYFVRIQRVDIAQFPRSRYGITNREYLKAFASETMQRREKGELCKAQMMEWDRFQIKKDQNFAVMQTLEFDVQLKAPVDMRLLQLQFTLQMAGRTLSNPYYFRAHVLRPQQLDQLQTEQEYNKSIKMMMF